MSMYPIASYTMPNSTTTVHQFSNIPNTFTHLELRLYGRITRANTWSDSFIYLNDDFSASYSHQFASSDGSSTASGAATAQIGLPIMVVPGTSIQAGRFGISIIQILDYANVSKFTTTKAIMGVDGNGGGYVQIRSGLWTNTNAVNKIEISTGQAGIFWVQGSRFTLYGIHGDAK